MSADEQQVSVSLHIEPGSDPIAGTVRRADGVVLPFTGWIELTAQLEDAHTGSSGSEFGGPPRCEDPSAPL